MELYFYYIDGQYIDFLKKYEKARRSFTCVPNSSYWNTNKFTFGAVLEVNKINYFVPVSSYSKEQEDVILMTDKFAKSKAQQYKVLGSLRFAYMIPAPNNCIKKLDIKQMPTENSRIHVAKELAYCRRNRDKIKKQAQKTYERVINKVDPDLIKHSCDFKLLEQAYAEYVDLMPRYLETTKQGVKMLQKNGIEFEAHPSPKKDDVLIIKVKNKDKPTVEHILSNIIQHKNKLSKQ